MAYFEENKKISLAKARIILGEMSSNMSDEDITKVIDNLYILANVSVNSFLKKCSNSQGGVIDIDKKESNYGVS